MGSASACGATEAQWDHPKPHHMTAGDQATLEIGEQVTGDQQTPLRYKKGKNPNPSPPSDGVAERPLWCPTTPLTSQHPLLQIQFSARSRAEAHLRLRAVRVHVPQGLLPLPEELNRTSGPLGGA